ncbi:E3 ubiquitin-protein ligase RAD18 isoform X2 [Sorex araneus]|uniref:E3 ubiquitin-protein ligase RAD18 isoform X2 n=1 Tax=Sorex araneus TaxID=42254 RepID=UPI00243350FD|nr:E3 ubiquitin-protein ligase RAD18 isoform X2 [Sorex araneus]
MDSVAEPRWPPGLAVMKTIDDLLRCGICFEYFNIAMMIPQCSHNYCSLCIRKFLSYKTQCPTCCVTVTEPDLKNNRVLDELVKSLNFARNHVLQFALESPPTSPASSSSKKPSARVDLPGGARQPQKQATRLLDSFLVKETGAAAPQPLARDKESKFSPRGEAHATAKGKESADRPAPASSATAGPETPSTSTPNPSPRVDCPVCGVSIPENHINKHLDCCLSRGEKKESLRSSAHKRKPLPKTVYNLLTDRELRRKLKQHGLSVHGTKQQLIKRHQEFVHMYNAQCDALHPKSAAEIVQEIENMEKTRMRLEASRLNESIMVFTKHQTEKEIDEIHSKYRKKHHNEFQLLVDQAKKGYKKTGEAAPKKVAKKEEACAERPSPVCPGQEEKKMRASGGPLAASRLPRAQRASSGSSEPERADDDSASCSDPREASPSSPESDSCNSSSSDIIRDLLEQEEAWEAAHRNEVPDTEWAPRHARRARAADGAETEPRNKRNRN